MHSMPGHSPTACTACRATVPRHAVHAGPQSHGMHSMPYENRPPALEPNCHVSPLPDVPVAVRRRDGARRRAEEASVRLAAVAGTGSHGRIEGDGAVAELAEGR